MSRSTAGRRVSLARAPKVSLLTVLSVVIPLATVGALALVRPPTPQEDVRPATLVPLHSSVVVCPSLLPGAGTVGVANADSVSGEVEAVTEGSSTPVELNPAGRVGTRSAVVVRAADDLAAGLVATRYGRRESGVCQRPQPQRWFTGLGAGPEHSSVLELVNPDTGPAVVDITLHSPTGPVDAPRLRGVTVPGDSSTTVDLAAIVPTEDELAAVVTVTRGRMGVFAADSVQRLGAKSGAQDWLSPQGEPATRVRMLGLGTRGGERTLVVANPTQDEAVVELKLIGEGSEFAPAGVEELRVPPASVRPVDLTSLLAKKSSRGARGVSLTSTVPITATVRSLVDGDLAHATGAQALDDRSALVVADTAKDLLIVSGEDDAQVRLRVIDARGDEVLNEEMSLTAGTLQRVTLPRAGVVVDVSVASGEAYAAVETTQTDRGRIVWPMSPLQVQALVPDVRPAHSSSR